MFPSPIPRRSTITFRNITGSYHSNKTHTYKWYQASYKVSSQSDEAFKWGIVDKNVCILEVEVRGRLNQSYTVWDSNSCCGSRPCYLWFISVKLGVFLDYCLGPNSHSFIGYKIILFCYSFIIIFYICTYIYLDKISITNPDDAAGFKNTVIFLGFSPNLMFFSPYFCKI
jgi:hypothetical protein